MKGIRYSLGREIFTDILTLNSGLTIFKTLLHDVDYRGGYAQYQWRFKHTGKLHVLWHRQPICSIFCLERIITHHSRLLFWHHQKCRKEDTVYTPGLVASRNSSRLRRLLAAKKVMHELPTHESLKGSHHSGWLRLKRRKQVRRGLRQGAPVWMHTRHGPSTFIEPSLPSHVITLSRLKFVKCTTSCR